MSASMDPEKARLRASISVALVDTNISVSNAMRATLRLEGYGKIESMRDIAVLERALLIGGLDLVIADADMNDKAILDVSRKVRAGDLGPNPFIAIIVTSWQRDWPTIRAAIDAGVDHVLANPISPAQLTDRINQIARNRKPFIVTSDYTGPDRRRDTSRVSTVKPFYPPNSLGEKERGRFVDDSDLQWRIEEADRQISEERLRRSIFQIAFLLGFAERAFLSEKDVTGALSYIKKLQSQARRAALLAERVTRRDLDTSLGKLALGSAEMLSLSPTEEGLRQLGKVADGLLASVFAEQPLATTRVEVHDAIDGYQRRLREAYDQAC